LDYSKSGQNNQLKNNSGPDNLLVTIIEHPGNEKFIRSIELEK